MRFFVIIFMFFSVLGFAQNKMLPYTEGGEKGWVKESELKTTEYVHSFRDFANGTLIKTSIDYSGFTGDPWVLKIDGNSYSVELPIDLIVAGYIYDNRADYNASGLSKGYAITGLIVLNVAGKLCFWFPRQGYWQGYNVTVYTAFNNQNTNKVTAITDEVEPVSGTRKYPLSSLIRQSVHSGNYTSFTPTIDAVTQAGNATTKPIFMSSFGGLGGLQGAYDPTKYSSVYSMSPSFALPNDGISVGSFYGICRSYEPDYGAVGNNVLAKAGLQHQYLFVQAGVTNTAIGYGLWTIGSITGKSNLNIDGNANVNGSSVFLGVVNANGGINMKATPLSYYTANISSDGNGFLNIKSNVNNVRKVSVNSSNELNATLTPFTAVSANDLVNDNQTVSFVSNDVFNLPAATKAVRMVNAVGTTNTGVTINLNEPTMKSKEQVLVFSGVGLAFNGSVVFNAPSGWFIYSGGSLAASRTFVSQQTTDAGQGCIFRVLFFSSDNTISIMRIKDN
jgi:hypothetical protein